MKAQYDDTAAQNHKQFLQKEIRRRKLWRKETERTHFRDVYNKKIELSGARRLDEEKMAEFKREFMSKPMVSRVVDHFEIEEFDFGY